MLKWSFPVHLIEIKFISKKTMQHRCFWHFWNVTHPTKQNTKRTNQLESLHSTKNGLHISHTHKGREIDNNMYGLVDVFISDAKDDIRIFSCISFAMHCDPIYIWLTTLKWWSTQLMQTMFKFFFWEFEWHIEILLSWDICLLNIYAEHVWIFCAEKTNGKRRPFGKVEVTLKTKKEKNTFQFDTYALHSTAH